MSRQNDQLPQSYVNSYLMNAPTLSFSLPASWWSRCSVSVAYSDSLVNSDSWLRLQKLLSQGKNETTKKMKCFQQSWSIYKLSVYDCTYSAPHIFSLIFDETKLMHGTTDQMFRRFLVKLHDLFNSNAISKFICPRGKTHTIYL